MKLLTTNFLTCAVKTCKSSPLSYPLHFRSAELSHTPNPPPYNELFLTNILPRLDYDALATTAQELGLSALMPGAEEWEGLEAESVGRTRGGKRDETGDGDGEGAGREAMDVDASANDTTTAQPAAMTAEQRDRLLRSLHKLLLETSVEEGFLVCGNCEYEYPIKEGVGNFLLPPHLV